MIGYHTVRERVLKPLRSLCYSLYYTLKKSGYGVQQSRRAHHVVVSLTSFPRRFNTLHLAVKSLLNQTMKPDAVLLVLTAEEVSSEADLPESVLALKRSGLAIHIAEKNLKPHNKYLAAMRLYPDSLIITVDDDNMYDRNLIKDLYQSCLKFPRAVSAKRVHKIALAPDKSLLPYREWFYEYRKETEPSFCLLATGVGGVLYPPGLLPPETFDMEKIRALCLNADDIWLKFMELQNNIPVVWVKTRRVHPTDIRNTQDITLETLNYHANQNDRYIAGLQEHLGIDLRRCAKDRAQEPA